MASGGYRKFELLSNQKRYSRYETDSKQWTRALVWNIMAPGGLDHGKNKGYLRT
jgi:hypothetical protein